MRRLAQFDGEGAACAERALDAERVVDHVVHACSVAGVEHVGVGSDFDGIQRGPRGLEDASCYGLLAERLLGRGFDERDVRRVLGDNLRGLYARVTAAGTRAATAELAPFEIAVSEKSA